MSDAQSPPPISSTPVPDARGWLHYPHPLTHRELAALSVVGPIARLSIAHRGAMTIAQARRLTRLPSVGWLRQWSEVPRLALEELLRVPDLQQLDVFALRGQGPLRGFERAVSLHRLGICYGLVQADLLAIAEAPALRHLSLPSAPLDARVLDALLERDSLEALDLEGTPFDDDMAHRVARASRLRELDLGATRITGRGLSRLIRMPALRHLDLWATALDLEDLAQLADMPALESLTLGTWDDATAPDPGGLTSLLCRMPRLTRLWLDGVDLDPEHEQRLREQIAWVRVDRCHSG